MHYTLHQLQVFSKVVELKSITRASEELHMTQPAVSIQLKNFQEQFDIPLTEVVGRQLYVTDFGKEIYHMAERIIEQVYAINYKTLAYKGQLSGRLMLSIVSTGKYIMPYFLSEFMRKNDGVDLIMDVTNKAKVISSLQNNEIDFALISVLPLGLKVNEVVLLENELYLVGNKSHKLSHRAIPKGEISKMPLIYREEGSGTRFVMESYFKKQNIQVRKKMELTSNEAVKQALIAGLGYSIMPLIGIRNELLNGDLKIIPSAGFPIKSKWRLIWLKGKKLSPIAEAFLEYTVKNKEQLLKKYFSWIGEINVNK
jgi:LysR family transcriptional regulator, low CO2-responsive transcriptional regulator